MSIFTSAYQAVRCGIELQAAFLQGEQIPVRIGIHLGEIVVEKEDVFGDAVNIASRIETLAKVGSVLISEKVHKEINNRQDIKTVFLGEFQFKNVFQSTRIYAVDAQSLYVPVSHELEGKIEPTEKIVDLPEPKHTFIGREHQVNSICALLKENRTRLLTIHGPGGMGKTSLSIKIGRDLANVFEHGVCFVPLDTLVDHKQVPQSIGKQLKLKEDFQATWLQAILDFLRDKHLLLILDNLEQILQSVDVIQQIIQHCPRVSILTTSRELLGLSEEMGYSLGSLNRPASRLFPGPKELTQFEAIRVFLQQAKFSAPEFQLDEDNAEAVVHICDLLEGLPLAIKLAAARLKLFSPEVISAKLRTNSNLLKTRAKDIAPRHQTIGNMVKWSYDLLENKEQELFQRLSLFRSGFTLEALESICPDIDALELVESFVNKSLLIKGEQVELEPRFHMLKLIRDYGLQQMENNPKKGLFFKEFANYYRAFAKEASKKLPGRDSHKWINYLDAEYQNLSAAMEWLIKNQPESAAHMGMDFWGFHVRRGFLREGLAMIESLLALEVQDKKAEAKLLEGAGSLSHNLGNYLVAKEYFSRSLELHQALNNEMEIAQGLNNVSWAEWRVGNYDQTLLHANRALKIFIQLQDQVGQAKSQNNLAWSFYCIGDYERTASLQQHVLNIYQQIGNKHGMAFAKECLGRAYLKLGKMLEGGLLIQEGIEVFQSLKNQQMLAFSYLMKAEYEYEQENYEEAEELLFHKSLPGFEKIGDVWGVATCHNNLGHIYLQQEKTERAELHWKQSLELFHNSSDKFGEASASIGLSQLNWKTKKKSLAESYLTRGLELASKMGSHELLMNGYVQRSIQTQAHTLTESIKWMIMADYHAQKLGQYPYQSFLEKTIQHQRELKLLWEEIQEEKGSVLLEELYTQELLKIVSKHELATWVQKLLGVRRKSVVPTSSNIHKDQPSFTQEGLSQPLEDPFTRKVRHIVEENLANHQFSVQDLCKEVGLSHSQLHRKLSSGTGKSITQFIRSIRLEKAKDLLLDPKLTIAAVAYDSGFKDSDYFHRVFKKTFDMTPTEFRKLNEYK